MVFLVWIILFAVTLVGAVADNASFTVQPNQKHSIKLNLRETDRVDGSFSVLSDDNTGINFYVIDPAGNTIKRYDKVTHINFWFVAQITGDYKLHFDNTFSQSYSKTIALNYNVVHFIMGMPQEQFLLIVIAVFIVIGLIAFALLSPKP